MTRKIAASVEAEHRRSNSRNPTDEKPGGAAGETGMRTTLLAVMTVMSAWTCRAGAQDPAEEFRRLRLPVGPAPSDVTAADMDGDGRLDLLVAAGGAVSVFLGDGAGAFRPGSTTEAGNGATGLVTGDFDEDGHTDVLMANHETSYVTLLFGREGGGLEATSRSRIQVNVSPHTHAVAAGDVNEDGRLDFLVDDRDARALKVFLGRGDGTFHASDPVGVGGDPYRGMLLADLNGDGHLDVATPNPREIAVLLGDGRGDFRPAPGAPYPAPSPFFLAALDFDGNGILDLAAAPGEGSDRVVILLGRGDGAFQPHRGRVRSGGGAGAVVSGDLDGDGFEDLVVTAYVANEVTLVFGGDRRVRVTRMEVHENPWGATTGDFDGDGRSDFAVALQGSDEVSVFLSSPD